jgi:hypothetical protein
MRRVLVVGIGIILVIAGLSRIAETPASTVAEQTSTVVPDPVETQATSVPPPTIRVVHQLVQVPVFTSPVRTRTPPPPPIRRARIEGNPEPARLASRARRVLLGDGHYRPEPFPRPTKD